MAYFYKKYFFRQRSMCFSDNIFPVYKRNGYHFFCSMSKSMNEDTHKQAERILLRLLFFLTVLYVFIPTYKLTTHIKK